MNNEQIEGQVDSLRVDLPYQADTDRVYQALCSNDDGAGTGRHLLLDSADIGTKRALKSLLLIDTALTLTCRGQRVMVEANSDNGAQLLPFLAATLTPSIQREQTATTLELEFPQPTFDQTEEQRLKALSNMEPLRLLQQRLTKANDEARNNPFSIFLGGVFGYDYVASYEQLPPVAEGENNCPDYVFYLAETLLVVDHEQQRSELIASFFSQGGARNDSDQQRYHQLTQRIGQLAAQCQLPSLPMSTTAQPPATPAITEVSPSADRFRQIVMQLKENILDGDIFQVVPSRRFKLPCNNPLAAYQRLKQNNPSPYMFFLSHPDFCLFGASPESALKYQQQSNQVELYPIAGTRPRGRNADGSINLDIDGRMELELRLDEKELSEHLMLVDLARNDLARICQPGSRYVADLLKVDRYSQVMHLVSRVVGQLRQDCDALHAYRACMNMGTLTGAPKVSAARLIREVEQQGRGSYGGAVGYLAGNGDMDTCIVIRSAFVKDQQAIVQAGAGVVYDSDADAEVAETENKAKAVLMAIQQTYAEEGAL
ncbi:anthranilate synthase component I [Idiomarina sp. OT37-5b]|uniref:anthranilate synthase component 1 n=1 Tax=Idiomarina sp. OT37-5b TaxID=2100422 RepID=UPI000CFA0063|nr:anthranilate synthase component 1 [Idiomarina sp. OT37-5b]AVJ56374.1 anthranilate synthase component I [Idiomarina sp. OT37-5b]